MGSVSSQSETPTTTSQSREEWKPIRLCGTLPTEVGTTEEYDIATNKKEWEISLMKGDLYGLQTYETKETIVLCPVNNTELECCCVLGSLLGLHSGRLCATTTCHRTTNELATIMED